MNNSMRWALLACGLLLGLPACGSDDATTSPGLGSATVLDLNDVKSNPNEYEWFDFRPNIAKLILAGSAETKHVAILWYTVTDGGVALHYHSQTESVYVIDGSQTDAKGGYPAGTAYFNPPGSGHQVTDSSGFFLLAYAAPPDFANTDAIEEYTPIRIDTTDPELTTSYPFEPDASGATTFEVPLDSAGGLEARFIDIERGSTANYDFMGNYLLVLEGSCDVQGVTLTEQMLVVDKSVEPRSYRVGASKGERCLALGASF
jgi:hypothetical protein